METSNSDDELTRGSTNRMHVDSTNNKINQVQDKIAQYNNLSPRNQDHIGGN